MATTTTRSRASSYQKVTQNEDNKKMEDNEEIKRLKSKRAERVSVKIHAVLWIIAVGVIIYCLDVFRVMFQDKRVNRTYFNIGLIGFGVYVAITLYLAIWLPYVKKITLEWSVYCPRMIPAATVAGVTTVLGYVVRIN